KYGPNDGNVLLADMVFPGGVTLTQLGSDHFMRNRPLGIATVALAITVINWLEKPDGESIQVPGGQIRLAVREIIKPPRLFRIPSISDIFSVSYCLLHELLPDVYLWLLQLLTR